MRKSLYDTSPPTDQITKSNSILSNAPTPSSPTHPSKLLALNLNAALNYEQDGTSHSRRENPPESEFQSCLHKSHKKSLSVNIKPVDNPQNPQCDCIRLDQEEAPWLGTFEQTFSIPIPSYRLYPHDSNITSSQNPSQSLHLDYFRVFTKGFSPHAFSHITHPHSFPTTEMSLLQEEKNVELYDKLQLDNEPSIIHVLIHGAGHSSLSWARFVQAYPFFLSPNTSYPPQNIQAGLDSVLPVGSIRNQFIAIDLRGHGYTRSPCQNCSSALSSPTLTLCQSQSETYPTLSSSLDICTSPTRESDVSLSRLTQDVLAVLGELFSPKQAKSNEQVDGLSSFSSPNMTSFTRQPIVFIGHSFGSSIATAVAHALSALSDYPTYTEEDLKESFSLSSSFEKYSTFRQHLSTALPFSSSFDLVRPVWALSKIVSLAGVAALDFFESNIEYLEEAVDYARERVDHFLSSTEAAEWCIQSGYIQAPDSLPISLIPMLALETVQAVPDTSSQDKSGNLFTSLQSDIASRCEILDLDSVAIESKSSNQNQVSIHPFNLSLSTTRKPMSEQITFPILEQVNSPLPMLPVNLTIKNHTQPLEAIFKPVRWRCSLASGSVHWRSWFLGFTSRLITTRCPRLLLTASIVNQTGSSFSRVSSPTLSSPFGSPKEKGYHGHDMYPLAATRLSHPSSGASIRSDSTSSRFSSLPTCSIYPNELAHYNLNSTMPNSSSLGRGGDSASFFLSPELLMAQMQGKLQVVPIFAGHCMHEERPYEVAVAIHKFVSRLPLCVALKANDSIPSTKS